jgi:hypothetical protein
MNEKKTFLEDCQSVNNTHYASMKAFLFGLLLAGAFAVGSSARAQIIAVNFDGEGGAVTAPTGVVTAYTWNDLDGSSGSATGLTETDGVGTSNDTSLPTTSITFASQDSYLSGNPNLGNLLNGYLDGNGAAIGVLNGTVTISVTNIPFALYDVYVYVGADQNGRTGDGMLGTEDLSFTSAAAGATAFAVNSDLSADHPSANTLLFTDISGTSFSYLQNAGSNNNSTGVMAIEIVAVPEPTSLGMMALAALACGGMTWIARRKTVLG